MGQECGAGGEGTRLLGRRGRQGFTLFELLVAVVLLGMISTMLYSVLNVGIAFSRKGEEQLARLAREQSLLDLLRRQVACAWYDQRQNRVRISGEENLLRIITRQPLLNRSAGTVLAVFRYDEGAQILYYLERKDYYNSKYGEEYRPEPSEMEPLYRAREGFSLAWDAEEATVSAVVGQREYLFSAKSQAPPKSNPFLLRR